MKQFSRLDGMQGPNEERTKMYLRYIEAVPRVATPQFAKSDGRVLGSAQNQASPPEGLL
jgi:hypothetical protein